MMTVQVRIKITHHLDYCLSSITTEWDMEVKTVGILSVLLFQHLKSWRNYYHRKVRIEKQGCTTTTGYSLVQDKLTIQWQFPIQEIWGRKINCVMRRFFPSSSVGDRPAPRGCTSTPDERKVTTI